MYRLIGVYSFGKGIFHRQPTLGVDLGDYRFSSVMPGDLVLSNIQAWEGAIAHATEQERGTVGTNRFLCYAARDPDLIDTNWARYYFLSPAGFPKIQKAAPGSVTRNRTLARERFEAIEIPLPPIEEQRCIAAQLDEVAHRVNRLMQLTERSTLLSGALRSSLLHPSPDPAEADGWARVRMGDLLSLDIERIDALSEPEFRQVGVLSFGRGIIDRGPLLPGDTKYEVLHRVRAGEVVMSRLKAWEGALAVLPEHLDGAVASTEFPTFTLKPGVDLSYIQALLRSPLLWSSLSDASKGVGARRERVSAERFLNAPVWLPPPEHRSIPTTLEVIRSVEEARQPREAVLAAVMPASLNRAFAGLS